MRSLAAAAALAALAGAQGPNVTVISGGHVWLENVGFSRGPNGGLFFSDAFTGEIFKVSANYTNGAWVYNTSGFITSGLDMFGALGFASAPNGMMYSTAVMGGVNGIIVYNPATPEVYDMIASSADMQGGYLINGLALDPETDTLIATSLGHLTDGEGEIVSAPVGGGPLTLWHGASGLFGSDGLWLDQRNRLAYVSELLTATVLVYDIDTGLLVRKFVAPGMIQLDDLTLSPAGDYVYGADLIAGAVVKFASNGTGTGVPVVTGLTNVTSCRFGAALGFNPLALYVTEGGGQSPQVATRRLLEVDFSNTAEGAWLREQYAAIGVRF